MNNAVVGQLAAPLEVSMVCMSVVEHGPLIAFAAYNEEKNEILIEESRANGYETQGIAERVLAHIRPNLLLVSNKVVSNENLLEVLTTQPPDPAEGAREGSDHQPLAKDADHQQQSRSIPYRLMKSATYEVRACKAMILKLRVRSLRSPDNLPGNSRDREPSRNFPIALNVRSFRVSSYHNLASMIDFESTVLVQAIGSLLSFLGTTLFSLEDGGCITINDIVQSKASLHMYVSSDTLGALNIFATEHHPMAAAKGRGNSKEGVSLFSLLDRTKSRTGRQRLREWMLKPLLDVSEISTRQDGVELFMLPDFQRPVATLLNQLSQVGAVDKILARMQKCCTTPNDFLVLIKSLSGAVSIFRTLKQDVLWSLQQTLQSIQAQAQSGHCQEEVWQDLAFSPTCYAAFVESLLLESDVGFLESLLERITMVVDEDATVENRNVVVRRGYKDQYSRLGETLREAGEVLSQHLPYLRSVLSTIFMPQVRTIGNRYRLPVDHFYFLQESLSLDFLAN
jgi:hypothetical protein